MKKIIFPLLILFACNPNHEIIGFWKEKSQNLIFEFKSDFTCSTKHLPTGQIDEGRWFVKDEIISIINKQNDILQMFFRLVNTESTKYIQFKNINQVYWGPEFYKQ
tara:strand:+ start:239 stop:556 length:318 start_codon:yes stop_codon:yes gene_type:complete